MVTNLNHAHFAFGAAASRDGSRSFPVSAFAQSSDTGAIACLDESTALSNDA